MKNLKEKGLLSSHEYKLLAHNVIVVSKQLFEIKYAKQDSETNILVAMVRK